MIDIKNDPKIEQWFNSNDIAESTRKTYLIYFQIFCNCIEKSPSEIIEESNVCLMQLVAEQLTQW